jgi:subtilisin family serine protease
MRLHPRLLASVALAALAVLLTVGGVASASPPFRGAGPAAPNGKIESRTLEDTAGGKSASFIVLVADRADLSAAYGMRDHDARGWYVYNTLRAHAERSQASIRAALNALGASYKSYWSVNGLVVSGDRALAETLAARADVRRIESDRPSRGIAPIKVAAPAAPTTIEWGVQRVNAPQVWAMGYTGQGIVLGNQDTGVRWTHNAVKNHYRGWNGITADHNYNWWDGIRVPNPGNPCGFSLSAPCDDDVTLGGGHGTHTTGTVLGDDGAGNQVGVAPGAEWIGCRNMEQGVGRPQTYLECFEFFLAPHDLNEQNPNPALRPHVMNNSWACVEGCAPQTLQSAVEACDASGILVEASAGNDGPACSTVTWTPAIYEASFTTGAFDINNSIAYFSSRGPVTSDGSMRLKPNIAAPGVDVRSALRGSDTEYGALSGTSMAGPHTVGVVALLWSARPDLVRRIDETRQLLEQTANPNLTVAIAPAPCGGTTTTQIPNNFFGYGRVDALAALNRAQATVTPQSTVTPVPTYTPAPGNVLVGHVTWQGRPPQPNALQQLPVSLTLKSSLSEANFSYRMTDSSGYFTVSVGTLLPGTYNWRVKGPKFLANSGSLVLTGLPSTQQEMGMMRAGDANNDNVVNATDFNIVRSSFGLSFGSPGYDDRADFTGDQVVNASDFNLVRVNFGTGGAPPLRPGGR